jgi:hypothetical protein
VPSIPKSGNDDARSAVLARFAGFQIADVAAHVSLPVAQVGKAALNLFQDFQNGVFSVRTLPSWATSCRV